MPTENTTPIEETVPTEPKQVKPKIVYTPELTEIPEEMIAPKLKLDREQMTVSLGEKKDIFVSSLDSGTMLVKSMHSNAVKTINIESNVVLKNPIVLSSFEARDGEIVAKNKFGTSAEG